MQESLPQGPGQQSLDEVIRSAVDLARVCLQMDVAFVTEVKRGVRIFSHVASAEDFAPIKEGDWDILSESYCQYVLNGAIPPIVEDSHVHPLLRALSSTERLGIRAHLGVPIRLSDGSVFGTFCCYSRLPRTAMREVEVEAMARYADLIATMLQPRILHQRHHDATSSRVAEVMEKRALRMAYQPIVDLATNDVVGFEALARFQIAPTIGPEKWFDDAHGIGRGVELEMLAIELAIANFHEMAPHTYLALNVSPETILRAELPRMLSNISHDRLVLEITEHVPVAEYPALQQALAPLRRRGVRLAIDDAGSGYASFRHILQLKPDIIKLDRSLISEIDHDQGRFALASALVVFAQKTGSKVVAEGVETAAELAVLKALCVQTAQGYLLGRPAFRS